MAIKNWPEDERPREKLLHKGPASLTNAELLALFFHTGIAGKSALELARETLKTYGSFRKILNTDHHEFCRIRGLGLAKYVILQGALEIGRRYLLENLEKNDILVNSFDTRRYLSACIRDRQQEIFACLFLDNKNRVIAYEELFNGTINCSHIHPREIVKRVLYHNAAGVIFAHNHTSGVTEPSLADKEITIDLQQILSKIETRLLDHLIIGDGEITSLAEMGLIENNRQNPP